MYQKLHASKESGIRSPNDGSSVNVSNAIPGILIATGQDAVSVAQSSWGHLTLNPGFDGTMDLAFSHFMPSLLVGSVGAGTVYASQMEGLRMHGCADPAKKRALAETIAAFALVGDVVCAAVVASNTKTTFLPIAALAVIHELGLEIQCPSVEAC